ncbi:MAG: hypothetical protein QF578_14740 [Alphaproteobacteria bacterium]|nr:hypothetical protein [Alphaproteobacteria bacterium]MDP6812907.1 hypothetical protein [Alphaproteobacteria bacterium]
MLSLPKILLLLVVIVGVVMVSKFLRGNRKNDDKVGNAGPEALDMTKCTVCGNFVAANHPGCERQGCPYGA